MGDVDGFHFLCCFEMLGSGVICRWEFSSAASSSKQSSTKIGRGRDGTETVGADVGGSAAGGAGDAERPKRSFMLTVLPLVLPAAPLLRESPSEARLGFVDASFSSTCSSMSRSSCLCDGRDFTFESVHGARFSCCPVTTIPTDAVELAPRVGLLEPPRLVETLLKRERGVRRYILSRSAQALPELRPDA